MPVVDLNVIVFSAGVGSWLSVNVEVLFTAVISLFVVSWVDVGWLLFLCCSCVVPRTLFRGHVVATWLKDEHRTDEDACPVYLKPMDIPPKGKRETGWNNACKVF